MTEILHCNEYGVVSKRYNKIKVSVHTTKAYKGSRDIG